MAKKAQKNKQVSVVQPWHQLCHEVVVIEDDGPQHAHHRRVDAHNVAVDPKKVLRQLRSDQITRNLT